MGNWNWDFNRIIEECFWNCWNSICCCDSRRNNENEEGSQNIREMHEIENINNNSDQDININIEDNNKKKDGKEQLLIEKEEDLKKEEKDLQDKKDNILKKEEDLNKREQELNIKISEKEKEFDKKEKEANLREKNINEKEKKNDLREKTINEKEKKINLQEKNINEKEKEINLKENILNEKENKLAEKEKEMVAKEKEINLEKNKLSEKEKQIDLNEKKITEKEKEIILKEKNISDKEKNLSDKEKNLSNKEKQINLNEKELSDKEKLNNDSKNKLLEKEKEINEKEQQINDYKNSLIEKEKKLDIDIKNKEKEIKQKENQLQYELIKFQKEKEKFENEKNLEKSPILVGLDNIGATCYMNATLQSLAHTEKLTEYFLNKFHYDPNDKTKIMVNEYYKLLTNLNDRNKKSYSPDDFKKTLSQENPQFKGIQANDSKDLINFLIERFHKELNNISNQNINNNNYIVNQLNENDVFTYFLQDMQYNYKSIISDLFYGVLETKSKCCGCQNIKYNFQIYSFLEFPLEQVNNYCFQNGRRNFVNFNAGNPDIDLQECFDYYQKIDLMTGENQMYCNICNCSYDSFYSTSLYSAPQYLIINLNRGKNAYYQCKVKFPEQLNLLNYLTYKDGITVLNLYAVICHYGPSSMSGHFMAYCRNKDNKWYLYNDSIVSPCTKPKQYNEGMPYILFYKAV